MSSTGDRDPDHDHPHPPGAGNDTLRLHSTDLFRGQRRVIIEHRGEQYCLRLTRNQRMILTKF